MSYFREYGVKVMLFVQEYEMLQKLHGREETISGACGIILAGAPSNKIETAKLLSRLTGETTVQRTRQTYSGKRHALAKTQVAETTENTRRALLTEDEILRLPGPVKDANERIIKPGAVLLFVRNQPAAYAEQALYFEDSVFLDRIGD